MRDLLHGASSALRHVRMTLLLAALAAFPRGAASAPDSSTPTLARTDETEIEEETDLEGETDAGNERDLWNAAESESRRDMEDSPIPYLLLAIIAGGTMLLLGMVVMRIALGRRKDLIGRLRPEKPLTEEEFEARVSKEMGIGRAAQCATDSPLPLRPSESGRPEGIGETRGPIPIAPGSAPTDLPSAVRAVVARLQAANLASDQEPPAPLGAEIPGSCVLRLRSGKKALVVPSDTPQERIFAMARLCDFAILARDDGSALVCRSLSEFLADGVFSERMG